MALKQGERPKMAMASKGVKGNEALHVIFLKFEQGFSFPSIRFRGNIFEIRMGSLF